jgi:hypothetical protein
VAGSSSPRKLTERELTSGPQRRERDPGRADLARLERSLERVIVASSIAEVLDDAT